MMDPLGAAAIVREAPPQPAEGRQAFRGHAGFIAGGVIVAAVLGLALLAPAITPEDPYAQNLTQRLVRPIWDARGRWENPLGTDALGRDYLSRLLYGARVSLTIGFSTAAMAGAIGTLLGLLAGYFGGRIDAVVTFLVSVRLAMPALLIALAVVAIVGGSMWIVILILGLTFWDRFAVVVRAVTAQVRRQDYVTSARCIGCSPARIIATEVVPNIANALIVVATLTVAEAILAESALSFLGLGVRPPTPSWGLMVAEGRSFMYFQPWLITIPGAAIVLTVLGINLFGDGLRDVLARDGAA